MWLQRDWGDGPRIRGRKTQLFAAWLAWSRFRVVIPVWDQQLGTLTWCIDQALRAVGGAPTYLLTDNARTVTMDHVAGVPVRHPEMVALGRHYGCKVETCVPFDPESKQWVSHCTSSGRFGVLGCCPGGDGSSGVRHSRRVHALSAGAVWRAGRRSLSLRPCARAGGLLLGGG